jgi:hypothetical protein
VDLDDSGQEIREQRWLLRNSVNKKFRKIFMDLPPVDSAAELFTGSRTKVEVTILISRLMEGEEPEALKLKYGSEPLEEAISELENRI